MASARWALLVVVLAALGCESPVDTDPLSHLPRGAAQLEALCARAGDNAITSALCAGETPSVTSLVELQSLLGLAFDENGRPDFALTANSSSLVARQVSAINPRAVLMNVPEDREDQSFIALAYTRGDQLVEIAVTPPTGETAFYLLRYERGCDDDGTPCSLQQRLLPETESGWTDWSIYDDSDLGNSVFDCLQCHQPGGPGTPRIYRMQELQNPWTHWMGSLSRGGRTLLLDYRAAHGVDETYAGIPGGLMQNANPIVLENFVKRTNGDSESEEPNAFPSQAIEDEVRANNPAQPEDNATPGRSATWNDLYQRAVVGEALPPPYHDIKITDPQKLETMTRAYVDAVAGTLSGNFPDIRKVFRDDALADLSLRPRAGLDGRGILVHMCAQCHNPRLDQSLTRARFDATDLDRQSREEKDAAIARLRLTDDDRFRMPPHFFRDLSDDEIEASVQELQR